ncbi:MAG: DUF1330 domain-containing protein [Betaproteobacteria bacterium]
MAAYIIADSNVTDPTAYDRYRALVPAALAAHGGSFLVRGGEIVPLEGDWSPTRIVVIAFPDLAAAKAFYDSTEYRAAREVRQGAADLDMIAVAGV